MQAQARMRDSQSARGALITITLALRQVALQQSEVSGDQSLAQAADTWLGIADAAADGQELEALLPEVLAHMQSLPAWIRDLTTRLQHALVAQRSAEEALAQAGCV